MSSRVETIVNSRKSNIGFLILAGCVLCSGSAAAHQEGANFSGAIIEPLRVHHAHIEDEQRLNLGGVGGLRTENGKRGAFDSSIELAAAWDSDFRFGSEISIPFSNTGNDSDDFELGDIELWPIKVAIVNRPETIFTGVLSIVLPTGRESRGFGTGETVLGGLLFFDQAYKNWFFGLNGEIEGSVTGPRETEAELAAVISYSFIQGTTEMAPTVPNQRFVPALSLELVSNFGLQGEEDGEKSLSVIPGVHLWHPSSGWAVRVGVDVPVTSDPDRDFTVLLQIGRHFDWSKVSRSLKNWVN